MVLELTVFVLWVGSNKLRSDIFDINVNTIVHSKPSASKYYSCRDFRNFSKARFNICTDQLIKLQLGVVVYNAGKITLIVLYA